MEFEWDEAKAAVNLAKHGISFEEAKTALEGQVVQRPDTRRDYGESRTITIGIIKGVSIVVVVHTDRQGKIRIISARRANRDERQVFETAFFSPSDD